MYIQITALSSQHLDKLLAQAKLGISATALKITYLSPGSVSYCLLADGEPVFAGGIVNLMWSRGEAWMLPTPFFKKHVKECYKHIKTLVPRMAKEGGFKRVQSTCAITVSTLLFQHLDFRYEGILRHFGPAGETCYMYARLF